MSELDVQVPTDSSVIAQDLGRYESVLPDVAVSPRRPASPLAERSGAAAQQEPAPLAVSPESVQRWESKYEGQWVLVYDGSVLASGRTWRKAWWHARARIRLRGIDKREIVAIAF